jgi:putative endonuclease
MHYLYLIESKTYDKYYVGQTSDLEDRLQRHNENRCKYTKSKGPWDLIEYKMFRTRSEAMKEEKRLKKTKNREYVYYYFKNQA